jgi:cytochrome c biogenesis factor
LVAAAALIGSLVLVFVIAFLLDPPEWVQVLLGIGLVLEGALLAWLVASALGQSREGRGRRGPRSIEKE